MTHTHINCQDDKRHPDKSISHAFNVDIACLVGVHAALIYNHFIFWINYNKAVNNNFIDNNYWTYGTYEQISRNFPYFTERQVKDAILKLEAKKLITSTQKYNKNSFDKTKWYAIPEYKKIVQNKEDNSNNCHERQICPIECTEDENSKNVYDGQICPIEKTNLSDDNIYILKHTHTENSISQAKIAPRDDLTETKKEREIYISPSSTTINKEELEIQKQAQNDPGIFKFVEAAKKLIIKHNPSQKHTLATYPALAASAIEILRYHDPEEALKVLEFALLDDQENNGFAGWKTFFSRSNPLCVLAEKYSFLLALMKSRSTKRGYRESSNPELVQENLEYIKQKTIKIKV